MEDGKRPENHLTSAAAFVEGGIQDACDDACSICLEVFCDSEPSTLTTCKHEFHLQCILEWCQRSSQCPMCWQSIGLKDPNSQELLDAMEHERNLRMIPPRNTTIFHHPTLGEFELQHLPVSASESELEERIIQHLAAAAAMGRARQLARREGQRSRASTTQGHPQFLVFSTHPNGPSANPVDQGDGNSPTSAVMIAGPNSQFITIGEDSARQADRLMHIATGSSEGANHHRTSSTNRTETSPSNQDRAGPSDFQSFSDTIKSSFGAFSLRCKESITKSTRGWKERLLAWSNPTHEPNAAVHREISQGIATVSHAIDHLEISEDMTNNVENLTEQQTVETAGGPSLLEKGPQASSSAWN